MGPRDGAGHAFAHARRDERIVAPPQDQRLRPDVQQVPGQEQAAILHAPQDPAPGLPVLPEFVQNLSQHEVRNPPPMVENRVQKAAQRRDVLRDQHLDDVPGAAKASGDLVALCLSKFQPCCIDQHQLAELVRMPPRQFQGHEAPERHPNHMGLADAEPIEQFVDRVCLRRGRVYRLPRSREAVAEPVQIRGQHAEGADQGPDLIFPVLQGAEAEAVDEQDREALAPGVVAHAAGGQIALLRHDAHPGVAPLDEAAVEVDHIASAQAAQEHPEQQEAPRPPRCDVHGRVGYYAFLDRAMFGGRFPRAAAYHEGP